MSLGQISQSSIDTDSLARPWGPKGGQRIGGTAGGDWELPEAVGGAEVSG